MTCSHSFSRGLSTDVSFFSEDQPKERGARDYPAAFIFVHALDHLLKKIPVGPNRLVFPRVTPVTYTVFASSSDWFTVLFTSVVICQIDYFLVLALRHSTVNASILCMYVFTEGESFCLSR